MKIMVISDTHGDTIYLRKALDKFLIDEYSKLYHLGDIGSSSIDLLNPFANKIKAVRGNNDYDFEKAKFSFDKYVDFDYAFNKLIVLTHGHYYSPYTYNNPYDIFLYGHTHVGLINKVGNKIIACPGSISLPRDNNHSFIEINENYIKLIDINSNKVLISVKL